MQDHGVESCCAPVKNTHTHKTSQDLRSFWDTSCCCCTCPGDHSSMRAVLNLCAVGCVSGPVNPPLTLDVLETSHPSPTARNQVLSKLYPHSLQGSSSCSNKLDTLSTKSAWFLIVIILGLVPQMIIQSSGSLPGPPVSAT